MQFVDACQFLRKPLDAVHMVHMAQMVHVVETLHMLHMANTADTGGTVQRMSVWFFRGLIRS